MGAGNGWKGREVLRAGGRSGSSNFLGSFGGFCGRRRLAAPLGLRRRGRGFADQFRRHHAGDEQLWPVIIKINRGDRKSTRLNSSHQIISYAVFFLKKKKNIHQRAS